MLYRKSGLKTHLHFSKGSSNPFWKCKSTAGSFIRQNQLMQIIVNSPSKDFVQRGEISHQGWRNQDITREWFSTAPISVASRASWLPPPLAAGARTHFLGACPEPHGWNIWDRNIETAENRICKRKRQELSAPGFNVWGGFEHLKYMSICTTVNFWTTSIYKQEKGLAPVTPTHAACGSHRTAEPTGFLAFPPFRRLFPNTIKHFCCYWRVAPKLRGWRLHRRLCA
mgnify:CR=1 FL=1